MKLFLPFFMFFVSVLGWAASKPAIFSYQYQDYSRHHRLEEQDRLHGRKFTFQPGLEIIADLDGAEVRLFEAYVGVTPWEADNLSNQTYRVSLEKPGYDGVEFWVSLSQDSRTVVLVTLEEPRASLEIVGLPPKAFVTIDWQPYQGGTVELEAGSHMLQIKAFGYESFKEIINIGRGEYYLWNYTGLPVPFLLKDLRISPQIRQSGDLRGNRISFSATAPGSTVLKIFNPQDQLIYEELYGIQDPQKVIVWKEDPERAWEEGIYSLQLEARGEDGNLSTLETSFQLDNRFHRAPRTLASGLSGMLYSPMTDMLPSGLYQFGSGVGVEFSPENEETTIPVWISGRWSFLPRWEWGGLLGLSARVPLESTDFNLRFYTAWRAISKGILQANLSLSFAYSSPNFSQISLKGFSPQIPGITAAMPWQLKFQGWGLLLAPQLTLTFLAGEGNLWRFAPPARMAGLLGFGIYQEGRRHFWGISGTLRSPTLAAGPLDWGFWVGAEGKWILPGDVTYIQVMLGVQTFPKPMNIFAALELGLTG